MDSLQNRTLIMHCSRHSPYRVLNFSPEGSSVLASCRHVHWHLYRHLHWLFIGRLFWLVCHVGCCRPPRGYPPLWATHFHAHFPFFGIPTHTSLLSLLSLPSCSAASCPLPLLVRVLRLLLRRLPPLGGEVLPVWWLVLAFLLLLREGLAQPGTVPPR